MAQTNLGVALDRQRTGRLFTLLVDSIIDYAIFMLDPAGNVITWNAGAQRFKGYKPDEIIGKHFSSFYTERDIETRKPWMELEVAAEVGRFEDEGWRVRKDGTRFWANVVITAIKDEDGTLLGYGKVTRDLTERRESEMRYRLLVEGVTDYAIYSLDTEGNITSWNMGAQRIKGYSTEEILGQHFSRFYTPEDCASGMPAKVLRTALEQGHFEGEGWRVRKDGTWFWSNVVVSPVYDEEGVLRGFSKITRDMSDRKRLLDEVQRHSRDLENEVKQHQQTNAELEAFSYSVSHDLRAPLRAIEGFSSALREDFGETLAPEALEYLDEIRNASLRMSRLVHDLLDYSLLSRVELALTSVNVRTAAESAMQSLGVKNGEVTVALDPAMRVIAHEPTLVQCLANLISNGLKFSRPGVQGDVRITGEPISGAVQISVADNGIGIEPQYVDKIFKVFERLHGNDEYPGTGIGLAIVKRGIERMRGQVFFKSSIGRGSTFVITLPQAATEPQSE